MEYIEISEEASGKLSHVRHAVAAVGNVSLLQLDAIGICGSRKASEAGLNYAYQLGRLSAEHGLVVVSGYATGVDQAAHRGALENGGQTIAVLAEGIERFSIRKGLRESVTSENLLALSEYGLNAGWTEWRAMQRNRTILALAQAMFVVEAGETGGTLQAGMTTLKSGKPLFVLSFANDRPQTKGNRILLERGAVPISTMRELKGALAQISQGVVTGERRLI